MEGKGDMTIIGNDSVFVTPNAVVYTDVKNMPRPTEVVDKDLKTEALLPWGDSNDFPQTIISKVDKNVEIGEILDKKSNLLYGDGLEWGELSRDEKGKEILKPLSDNLDKEIRTWCKRSNINRYIIEASKDINWFVNAFVEAIKSRKGDKIAQLCVQAAEECRWGPQNAKGLIDTCYINANWPDATIKDAETKSLSVIDPYYDAAANFKAMKQERAIYPLSYARPGNKFYQKSDWHAIIESGWLDVSELIPKFKKALMENQSTLQYEIKIADIYWVKKFKDYETLPKKEQNEIKQKEVAAIQDLISGAENAGKNFYSVFLANEQYGKEIDLIKITPIDNKIKSGQFLEDGKDASLYTMSALGLHPALTGTMPNSGLGGAGSNIREAYNLHMLTNKSRQDLILEPLNLLVAEYNGWENVTFRFRNQFMTTLDTGTETTATPQSSTTKTDS